MKPEKIILFVIILIALINFLLLSFDVLFYKYDIDFSEGFMFYGLQNLENGIPIYQNPEENYFNIIKYPPIYYLISYPLYKIFGLNLFSLRIVSAIFSLLTILVLFKFLIKIKKGYISAAIFALFPIASTVVFWQTFQARLEWIAMFFSISSIFLSYRYNLNKNEKLFYMALVFANLAFLTKQLFFAPILAITIFYRNKFFQIIKFELLVVIALLIFNHLTDGNFLLHITEFSKGLFLYRADLMNSMFIQYGMLFVLSLLSIYLIKDRKYGLIKIAFLISLISNFILLIRHGSWIYYLLEPILYSSILLYISFTKVKKPFLSYGIIAVILISVFIWNTYDSRNLLYIFDRDNYPPIVNYQTDLKIIDYVEKNDGNCYTEHTTYLFPYGKILPESWLLIELYRNKIIDENSFEFINNYKCLIFYGRILEFPNFNTIISSYKLKEKLIWIDHNLNKRDILVYERSI